MAKFKASDDAPEGELKSDKSGKHAIHKPGALRPRN
jgi:hypothetical protein